MTEYKLDTSAIGEIDDGAVSALALYTSKDDFYISHIQEDELDAAGDYAPVLTKVLDVVDADSVATHGFILGISKLGRAKLGYGVKGIERKLSNDDGNELMDAIRASTAIQNDYILVTHDPELRTVVNEETPGQAISIAEFKSGI